MLALNTGELRRVVYLISLDQINNNSQAIGDSALFIIDNNIFINNNSFVKV